MRIKRVCAGLLVISMLMVPPAPVRALEGPYKFFLPEENWDAPADWEISGDDESDAELSTGDGRVEECLVLSYELGEDGGWVQIRHELDGEFDEDTPLIFAVRAESTATLEIKFVDEDGSNFVRKVDLSTGYADWTQMVVYLKSLEYGWGGDSEFDEFDSVYLAVSGTGSGTVYFDETGPGSSGMTASFPLAGPRFDPDRDAEGTGFIPRRSETVIPEDRLVLEWLKAVQDTSSDERQLLASMEDNIAQTFNNALAAMAFILTGEQERAERILDFYSDATNEDNTDITLQNFFYQGEPRGFYQFVLLRDEENKPAYHNPGGSDRWIGDMAWLLIAYSYYAQEYDPNRYTEITNHLRELIASFYTEAEEGGYIQHGWRNNDSKLHEEYGHHEANIDCYAALKLCGEHDLAEQVKKWLDHELEGKRDLPLDVYSWRVLAFGPAYAYLLDIPEQDLRYRKTLFAGGQKVMGFFNAPSMETENIWLDGTGHMACAFYEAGETERGNFYTNQYDPFLIYRRIEGVTTRALPYAANQQGGYTWVDPNKGFVSTAAWYLFAKKRFNPFTLSTIE